MRAWEERRDFRTLLEDDPEVTLSSADLDDAFDLQRSLRHLDRVSAALDDVGA
jgi:adenylosuccinate lyase